MEQNDPRLEQRSDDPTRVVILRIPATKDLSGSDEAKK
jgi:hypothetical protein